MKRLLVYIITATVVILTALALSFFIKFGLNREEGLVNIGKCIDFPYKVLLVENDSLKEKIFLEVVCSKLDMQKGLSGREDLPTGNGMLFVFDKPSYPSIWMKDMKFDIDIVWLDERLRVTDVFYGASKDSYPKTFISSLESKFVLELKAGGAKKFGIKNGVALIASE